MSSVSQRAGLSKSPGINCDLVDTKMKVKQIGKLTVVA